MFYTSNVMYIIRLYFKTPFVNCLNVFLKFLRKAVKITFLTVKGKWSPMGGTSVGKIDNDQKHAAAVEKKRLIN